MNHLAEKIKQLQGDRTLQEMANRCGVSHNVFSYLAMGHSVKLSTLRRIADAFALSESAWLELLIAWIRLEIGEKDFARLDVRVSDDVYSGSVLKDAEQRPEDQAARLVRQLTETQREEVFKAMQRPEVLNCLPAINCVWERFDYPKSSPARQTSPSKGRRDTRRTQTMKRSKRER